MILHAKAYWYSSILSYSSVLFWFLFCHFSQKLISVFFFWQTILLRIWDNSWKKPRITRCIWQRTIRDISLSPGVEAEHFLSHSHRHPKFTCLIKQKIYYRYLTTKLFMKVSHIVRVCMWSFRQHSVRLCKDSLRIWEICNKLCGES